ncbi:hypothetical protein BDV96DRAFT_184825 [Lophiotrema nucula]|uniref:ADF-H domain-containing protein n=1 Tax=Lophiotrema nucula TaxID=690887 RepID=A0A6A5YWL9_9PLEO|nr:hypothetical protein BDV96DRAFT_184825 [Lophiotrema nucula]
MSLNGLDDAKVTEAYQGALAEAGGWFLLKYASRDAVELLTRGTGGPAEARGAVAQYEEKSPLYGFLLYRRRKVIIKYIPEGTSRLLQARVAVHFTAVTEKFTPHDTTISIASADELSDTALISACSLHTAAPSSCSSSGSSRRHKLDEITEDAEEGQGTVDDTTAVARPKTAASSIPTIVEPPIVNAPVVPAPASSVPELSTPAAHPKRTSALVSVQTVDELNTALAQSPAETPSEEKPDFTATDYRESLKNYDLLFEHGPDPRMSSQTARPALSDLYAEIYAQYNKPKVKLGPRPRPSMESKRPHTSGTGAQNVARPVSSLPPGMRTANRKTMEPKRPKSRDTSVVPSIAFPPPPPIPAIPEVHYTSHMNPPKSPASVRSLPYTLSHKAPAVTPEKQRLMKALELRKKQMKARKEKEVKNVDAASEDTTSGAEIAHNSRSSLLDIPSSDPAPEEPTATVKSEDVPAKTLPPDNVIPSSNDEIKSEDVKPVLSTEDSVAELMSSQSETDDQHSAASACSPTSAQTQGSSAAPSTRPSSISEDDNVNDSQDEPKADAEGSEQGPIEDEKDSVESTPTVVPDKESSASSSDATALPTQTPTFTSDDALLRRNKRESMVFMPPSDEDDVRSRRRSKRESRIFFPVTEASQFDDVSNRRTKRESMIFAGANVQQQFEAKEKRRAMADPIQIHLSAENSEAEYLSDDSFMEELQSATFEQAKPISVSKSPITPVFPSGRKGSVGSAMTVPERSMSQQFSPGRLSPDVKARKSSGPWLSHANTDTVVTAKKINVSSGISQRIKALAEKSNRDSTASPPPHSTQPPVYNVQQSPKKPESVQVTARIVRDGRVQKPTLTMPTDSTPLELHHSPIIIDHQKSTRPSTSSRLSPTKVEPTSPRPPSSSHSREQSLNALPRSSSESSWRSFGRRLSESRPPPRSQSTHSFESADEKREDKKEKKDSRTSKLFKRMSQMSSISRKNQGMSTISAEEEYHMAPLPSLREPPPAVQVGDLNVQFPDTLLWKRRWVEIDGSGNLVLSLSKSNEQSKGITKRYHLSEFRMPYAPDQDRQELPNSVVLDFIDGRTLQCACETYVAQVQVLQILREAHDAWLAYGQFQ